MPGAAFDRSLNRPSARIRRSHGTDDRPITFLSNCFASQASSVSRAVRG